MEEETDFAESALVGITLYEDASLQELLESPKVAVSLFDFFLVLSLSIQRAGFNVDQLRPAGVDFVLLNSFAKSFRIDEEISSKILAERSPELVESLMKLIAESAALVFKHTAMEEQELIKAVRASCSESLT